MASERFAAAKINLFLHVGPLGGDGYHPLASLVTFADVGDVIRMRAAAQAGFRVEGPFAGELAGEPRNLVTRVRDLVLAEFELAPPFELTLDKRLPIASGVGGGSSDAAATLMLLAETLAPEWLGEDDDTLVRLAEQLGSDVPMCLNALPCLAEGRGERLSYPPTIFPALDAVLVNPLQPSPTGAVYRAYDDAGAPGGADAPHWPEALETAAEVAQFLSRCRNDLEGPAISRQPAIAQVLAVLGARPETLFARMSGSGATCFAICANHQDRRDLAFALQALHPDWWVADCVLKGFSP